MTITPQMRVSRNLCFETLDPASLIKIMVISCSLLCSLVAAARDRLFLKISKSNWLNQKLTEDKAKHSTKEAEERKQRELMEQEIAKAQEETEGLNMLRKARERRVPPPSTENGVVVSVRHVDLGVLT